MRLVLACVGAYLVLYLSWQAFDWLPLERGLAANVLGLPLPAAAAWAAWRASRRAAASPRLRSAWRWIAVAVAAEASGIVVQMVYTYVLHTQPYPSLADPLYLIFYPLLLVGILRFPAARRSGRQKLELALDCAIVAFGGGAVFLYFVLGPSAVASGSTLATATSIAYPVGSMILLVGLGTALLRSPLPETRGSVRMITAAVGLTIVGDLVYGYLQVHGLYESGNLVDSAYILSYACFLIVAVAQRPVSVASAARMTPRDAGARVTWLPYAAIAAALTILFVKEYNQPFFPDLSTAIIVMIVMALVVGRQVLSLGSLRHSRARLAEAQQIAQLGSWEWDVERDEIERSEEELRLYGLDPATPATPYEAVLRAVHPDDRERSDQIVRAALQSGEPFSFEMRITRSDGEVRTLLTRGDVKLRGGRVARVHGTHQDITERKLMEAQLEYQARHDPLTGLYNRRHFSEQLDRVLAHASRYRRPGALLMLDVDDFKRVNDTYGHATGDLALRTLSAAIVRRARSTDIVARLGGDEFAILLPETDEEQARAAAEGIRLSLAESDMTPAVHVSIGIALFEGTADLAADDMLIAADLALYEVKENGKDQVRVYHGRPPSRGHDSTAV